MPSLADKLKSLGVKTGADHLKPPPKVRHADTIQQALGGSPCYTKLGESYVVDSYYPTGHAGIKIDSPLETLARWIGDARIADLDPGEFVFLDTETTGLSGGTGTYAFLIGAGRFEQDRFHVAQFFMRDPIEEPALLAALEEFIAPCQALVTFNGKSFDVPLLLTRFISHGWRPPIDELIHIDLLHLARRLWRDRLPSRTLANLEVQILDTERTDEDVPGWMIPSLYFQYLRENDASYLKNVFYHNGVDITSLAALLNHMAGLLANPLEEGSHHGVDLLALANLFENLGDLDTATKLYIHGLEHEDAHTQKMPKMVLLKAIQNLALIYKRQEDWDSAVSLWVQAAHHHHLDAHLELAKYYEHRKPDLTQAIQWTETAIKLVEIPPEGGETTDLPGIIDRDRWLQELQHRLKRLQRKISLIE